MSLLCQCFVGTIMVLALVQSTTAQSSQGISITASFGGATYTNQYSPHGYQKPKDVGYIGRMGVQASPFTPRIRFAAEYEFLSVQEDWVSIDCVSTEPCEREPSELYGMTFGLETALGSMTRPVAPFLSIGTGWLRVRDVRRQYNIGPKTEIGLGLVLKPVARGLVRLSVESRYTFFYFSDATDKVTPNHVSLVAAIRVLLVRW
ncbi:MAG: hypothetical protein WBW88_14935 [Rhodothermales bacterium]